MAPTISRAAAAALLLCGSLLIIATSVQAFQSVLLQEYKLKSGESLRERPYEFRMQDDCNLVLYKNSRPIWATNTGGLASRCHFILQNDGNGVIYSQQNKVIWSTSTNGRGGSYIIVQCDGNVVMYTGNGNAVWATDTSGKVQSIDLEEGNRMRKPSTDIVIDQTVSESIFSWQGEGTSPGSCLSEMHSLLSNRFV